MEKIFKNRLSNYEETPPDFILNNLKKEISTSKSNFFNKNKYYIASSIIIAVVISSLFIFNNKTEEENLINNITNVSDVKQQKVIKIKKVEKTLVSNLKENIVENDNKINTQENITKTENKNIPTHKIEKYFSAGTDAIICGNTYKLSAKNTKNGKWLSVNNIDIKEKNNPNTTITAIKAGVSYLVWEETISDKIILDTVKITFVNYPMSDIEIEQTNEVCANKNAEINFITSNRYTYTWNDGFKTNLNLRKNLSAGTYKIQVNNSVCESTFEINIINSGAINVDFYHSELYSAIDIPFYFTNTTKLEFNENIKTNYFWDFGDGITSNIENPEHTYKKGGNYNVKLLAVANNGCKDSLTLKVKVDEKEIKMPNIFTPNGDGKHDMLILNPKPLKNYYAVIYNRAGKEITHWDDPNIGWNGKLQTGDNASEGVYYYIVSGIDTDGKRFSYKSFVNLNR